MGDLTRNFSRWEFRCPWTGRDGIQMPLVDALQALRDAVGGPITVTSGYRHVSHPIEVGKGKPGQHVQGLAADIVAPGVPLLRLYETALAVPPFQNGGIGVYPETGHLHVDARGHQARWGWLNRRMVEVGAALAVLTGGRADG